MNVYAYIGTLQVDAGGSSLSWLASGGPAERDGIAGPKVVLRRAANARAGLRAGVQVAN